VVYRFPLLALAISILLAWNGCATDPEPTMQEIIQRAVNRHLPQDFFAMKWGPPNRTMSLKSGETVWIYERREAQYFQTTGFSRCESDILTFDQDGKLEDWQQGVC
jgi:hypothetical protein